MLRRPFYIHFEEARIITIVIPNEVQTIMDSLEQHDYETYIVGGCVRDSIIGVTPHDWDICTSATPEEIINVFGRKRIKETGGLKHGTVCLYTNGCGLLEITSFRAEGEYTDKRRPDNVSFSKNIHDDLKRRDFTMNALAYHSSKDLIDDFNGVKDIKDKVIRCVGNAQERLAEDPLRILRAIRFQSKTGFRIEKPTKAAMKSVVGLLSSVSYERVMSELRSIISGPHAMKALKSNAFALCQIIPEFTSTIECKQINPWHIYNVFEHSLYAVNAAACIGADEITRMALLFHDIGKPSCITTDEEGINHFNGHVKISEKIARDVLFRLRFPRRYIDLVCELIGFHDVEFVATLPAAKRWLNKLGEEQLRRLMAVRECDSLAQSKLAVSNISKLGSFSYCVEKVVAEKDCFSKKDLVITGKDLIKVGISPGPNMGTIFNILLQEVIDSKIENNANALICRAIAISEQI